MDVSSLLGTVLGLSVAYWILATSCSFFLEVINSLRNIRGRALIVFMGGMLGDIKVAQFYGHPLIEALKKPNFRLNGNSTAPSYIPSETFTTALIDVISPVATHGQLTYQGLLAALNNLQTQSPGEAVLARTLLPLIDNVQQDLAEAKSKIAKWYDDVMDRATGWYKRRCMVLLGIVGLVFAASFNIDSIDLARRLMASADLRREFEVTAQYIRQDEEHAAAAVRAAAVQLLPGSAASPLMQQNRALSEMSSTDRAATLESARNVLAANVSNNAYFSAGWIAAHAGTSRSKWILVKDTMGTARTGTGETAADCPKPVPPASQQNTDSAHIQWCRFVEKLDQSADAWKQSEDSMASAIEGLARTSKRDERGKLDTELAAAQKRVRELSAVVADLFWSQSYVFLDTQISRSVSMFVRDPRNESLVIAREAIHLATDQISKVQRSLASSRPGFAPFERKSDSQGAKEPFWPAVLSYVVTQATRLITFQLPVLGWLITALMISLGAPFWYDLIGKVVSMRGSGGKPGHGAENES